MKYICDFCGTEMFSAAENLDGVKCYNCKKGRLVNPEIMDMDLFLAELDADLMEMEIDMGLEPGTLTAPPKELKIQLEICKNLQCDACKEDCGDPLAIDPDLMKKHPEMFGLTAESYPDGIISGLKEIGEKNKASLLARIYDGIKRKSGEYCRNCVYHQLDPRTEGKAHYSEGNCTIDNWKRYNSFDWCRHYSRKKKQ